MIMEVYNVLKDINVPISWNVRPSTYPSITYFFFGEYGKVFGDGEEIATSYSLQVDIWFRGQEGEQLEEDVKTRLKAINYYRTDSEDLFEQDINVHHKALRFNHLKEV